MDVWLVLFHSQVDCWGSCGYHVIGFMWGSLIREGVYTGSEVCYGLLRWNAWLWLVWGGLGFVSFCISFVIV